MVQMFTSAIANGFFKANYDNKKILFRDIFENWPCFPYLSSKNDKFFVIFSAWDWYFSHTSW